MQLNEINMSPSNVTDFISSHTKNVMFGFELECIWPEYKDTFPGKQKNSGIVYAPLEDQSITPNVTLKDVRRYCYDEGDSWLEDDTIDVRQIDNKFKQLTTTVGGSLYDWCMKQNITTYKEVVEFMNVVWPGVIQKYEKFVELEDSGVYGLVQKLQKVLKKDIIINTKYHAAAKNYSKWYIEPDSSIKGNGLRAELVSPVFPYDRGIKTLNKLFAYAREHGETNVSTGFHIGVSFKDSALFKNIDWLRVALFLGENSLLQGFDRTFNSYTKPFIRTFKQKPYSGEADQYEVVDNMLFKLSKDFGDYFKTVVTDNQINDRYVAINIKSNYVEFRAIGGDYLNNDQIVNTINRYVMCMLLGADHEIVKNEYRKKLYKYFSDVMPSEPQLCDMLAGYVSGGELPQSTLKSLLKLKFGMDQNES